MSVRRSVFRGIRSVRGGFAASGWVENGYVIGPAVISEQFENLPSLGVVVSLRRHPAIEKRGTSDVRLRLGKRVVVPRRGVFVDSQPFCGEERDGNPAVG